MEALIDILSPEQVDAIVAAYGSIQAWIEQTLQQCTIIVEDIFP